MDLYSVFVACAYHVSAYHLHCVYILDNSATSFAYHTILKTFQLYCREEARHTKYLTW